MRDRLQLGLASQEDAPQQMLKDDASLQSDEVAVAGRRWTAGGLLGSVLRRYQPQSRRLQLCETLSLGGRRSVALIECDGERLLVTMSPDSVSAFVRLDAAGAAKSEGVQA